MVSVLKSMRKKRRKEKTVKTLHEDQYESKLQVADMAIDSIY
jgi:hypothetical protein